MFGISIFAKEYWSRGYGTDAAMALLDYAFNRLNLRKVNSYFLAFNERSRRLHVALGMKQEGVRRKEDYFNGEYHDELLFGVFREEWEPAWRRYRERVAAK
jgi:RimJ/RimL family protein N-acetyltransferase